MLRMATALATLVLSTPAWACGGLFCNVVQPVDQTGEDIVFAVDGASNQTEMHVQIAYEGPANEFAWVVPVMGDPTLRIGTERLFALLSVADANHTLIRDDYVWSWGSTGSGTAVGTGTGTGGGGSYPGVTVVRTEAVGPYETVTLQADSSAALLQWLQGHSYDLPAGLDPLLANYVGPNTYFVALRLAKDEDVGDLAPLVLTYPGTRMAIPIQLTAIAANPDMRLKVNVLGPERAVPESYLHVQLNPLAVDWWNQGGNLDEVIGQAADEAGGQAFFTDYSGPPSIIPPRQIWQNAWGAPDYSLHTHAADLLFELARAGVPLDQPLLEVLQDHLGLDSQQVTDATNCILQEFFFNGSQADPRVCMPTVLDPIVFDPIELAADLEERVFEPKQHAVDLLTTYRKLTRMTSSVSPAEMTVDPTFVFNPDMGNVENTRSATLTHDGSDFYVSQQVLEVDGLSPVTIPSDEDLDGMGLTAFEWLQSEGLTDPAALVIERTFASGPPEPIVDNTPGVEDSITASGSRSGGTASDPTGSNLTGDEAARGCGCTQTPWTAGWLALFPLLIAARKRQEA